MPSLVKKEILIKYELEWVARITKRDKRVELEWSLGVTSERKSP